jgi:hypothetical protein
MADVGAEDSLQLRAHFEALADRVDSANQPRMSKDKVREALESLRLQRNEEELNELFGRIDINDDGEIDFDEFRFMVQSNTQLEMLMRSLPVHRVLANQFGGSIERYSQMSDSEMDDMVLKSVPLLSGILKQHARSLREAEAAQAAVAEQTSTAAGKFAFTLHGGDLDDYHGGVSERVGEPHADPAEGMEKEHTSSGDADVLFSSSNYGVTTCPRREWMIVTTGGVGLRDGDARVLRPLEYYDELERVKDAGLTRPQIIAIILYTGPMFQIYNGVLRRFGHCGVVDEGTQPVTIMERCVQHDNSYPSTVHCLVSGIKKLQQAAGPEHNRGWLYRGLSGGQLPASFRKRGFAEWAFMSTTKDLSVAVDYSGAKQGKAATVLKIEMSDVDAAVGIKELSQYPREEEWLWNVLTYLQYLEGREEVLTTPHGLCRVITVKANSNGRALTVEELAGRRKKLHLAAVAHKKQDVKVALRACDSEQVSVLESA